MLENKNLINACRRSRLIIKVVLHRHESSVIPGNSDDDSDEGSLKPKTVNLYSKVSNQKDLAILLVLVMRSR